MTVRMTDRRLAYLAMLLVSLSACHDRVPKAAPAASNAGDAPGRAEADAMIEAARRDALEARLATLEKEVAILSAKVDNSDTAVLEARIGALEQRATASSPQAAASSSASGSARTPRTDGKVDVPDEDR